MMKFLTNTVQTGKEENMQEKFTRQAQEALTLAKKTAQSCKHNYIGTENNLLSLIDQK